MYWCFSFSYLPIIGSTTTFQFPNICSTNLKIKCIMKKQYLFSLLLCMMVGFAASAQQFLADIKAGADGSDPRDFVEYNGNIYFTAGDGIHGAELWKYNPVTNATMLVEDLRVGSGGSNPIFKTVFNGKLYFAADKLDGGASQGINNPQEFYVYDDATQQITELILPCSIGCTTQMNPKYLTVANGALYFDAVYLITGANQPLTKLIKYDGANFSVASVSNAGISSVNVRVRKPMLAHNNDLYFSASTTGSGNNNNLVRYNTNTNTASLLVNFGLQFADYLTEYAGKIYFMAIVNSQNRLREYDPQNGTVVQVGNLVADTRIVGHAGILYFGTAAGYLGIYNISTQTDATLATDGINSGVSNLEKFSGNIYFQANSPTLGRELYKYDTTSSAISLVADINNGANNAEPRYLRAFSGNIYFSANDGTNGHELWKYDGTSLNTVPTTVGTIPNISQVENNTTNQTIDLTQYFADAEDGAAGLTYTVTTTDPSYFSTNISGTDLLVNFNSGFGGSNTVTIQAEDSGGLTTTQSFTVTVTQQQCTVPTNVSVSNISFFDADISWTGSADAADGYQWYVMAQGEVPNQGGATTVASGSTASGTTTASVTGLNFSTNYDVYVEALCSVTTTSSLSSVASFTTLTCQSPTNLTNSNITDTAVTATWTASATAFDGYNWYVMNPGEVPGTDTALDSGVVTNTSVNVTGLTAATSYDLYIQSKCVTGSLGGAVDTFVSFTTTASCTAPTNVAVTNITAATLDISWTASADATNGYRWYILPSGSTDTTQAIETNVTTNTTVTGINASNLAAGTSYDTYVVSRCSATVNSGLSLVESFTMPAALPLITISGPISISENGGNLVVNFMASQQATQNIDISLDFSGAATLNSDYTIPASTATIVTGFTATSFNIPITDDNQLEALENIIIDITGVTNGIEDGIQQLEVLIEDNEASNISFTDSGQTLVTLATDVVLGEIDNNPGLDALFAKDTFSDRVFFNNGSGILSNSGQTLSSESITFKMATGNFVGSNNNDVVLAKGSECSVLLNNTGNYTQSVNFGTGTTNEVVEVADIDSDGLDDIIVGKTDELEVYINDYTTNNFVLDFSLSQTLSFGTSNFEVKDIKVSDFNQDGDLDIVIATTGSSHVFYGTGGGQFNTNAVILPNSASAFGVDVFDIDNNGFEDFVFASLGYANQIVLNNGTSGFSLMPLTPISIDGSTDVAFIDLDNDNDMDIVFSELNRPDTFWENIGGVFADNDFNITNNSLGTNALDVGDIDGDGDMDIIYANIGATGTTSSRIWFNNLQTLSDNDFDAIANVKLYPNPVKNHFTIAIQNSEIQKVKMFNIQGQLVKTFGNSESYDIKNLESGLYFVNIRSSKGVDTIKIIKE